MFGIWLWYILLLIFHVTLVFWTGESSKAQVACLHITEFPLWCLQSTELPAASWEPSPAPLSLGLPFSTSLFLSCSTLSLIKTASPQKRPHPGRQTIGAGLDQLSANLGLTLSWVGIPLRVFFSCSQGGYRVFQEPLSDPICSLLLSSSATPLSSLPSFTQKLSSSRSPALVGSPSSHVLWVHGVPCPLVLLQKVAHQSLFCNLATLPA